ncbi:MAG: DUF2934 domain-containing protein [Alphaproteobacteria bacterium]|nr:DUF2934 domain-containing protein [Alphaproteobacteria bacterium]MBF0391955.1 DUF2934 domain-containing protein [Alphaproteobacteria bacterium]
MDELEDRIRQRAYELWEQEGRPEGRALQHWDQAAREVLGETTDRREGEPVTRPSPPHRGESTG